MEVENKIENETKETIEKDERDIEIEKLKNELKEQKNLNHSLSSQKGHLEKQYNDLKNKGMSEEERKNKEFEDLKKELEEARNNIKLKELGEYKEKYSLEFKLNNNFKDLVVINSSMDEIQVKNEVKRIFEKQENYKKELLSEYSITENIIESKKANKENFVDNLIEKRKQISTNLLLK